MPGNISLKTGFLMTWLIPTSVFDVYFSDIPQTLSRSELESLFRVEDIVSSVSQNVHQLPISACTGKGLSDVIRWLEQNTK